MFSFSLFVFSNYAWLMLAAVRALVEQQPAEEDYSKFRWTTFFYFCMSPTRFSLSKKNSLRSQDITTSGGWRWKRTKVIDSRAPRFALEKIELAENKKNLPTLLGELGFPRLNILLWNARYLLVKVESKYVFSFGSFPFYLFCHI